MHKLLDYVCDEMMELERKADKDGKLSMAEMQYLDMLARTKKNLLKADEMGDGEYSKNMYSRDGRMMPYYDDGVSMARKRDSMGRYSRADHNSMLVDELRDLMHDAKDEPTRAEFRKFIQKLESM